MAGVVDVSLVVEAIEGGVRIRLLYTAVLDPWEVGLWFAEEATIVRHRGPDGAHPQEGVVTVTTDPSVVAPSGPGATGETVRLARRLPPIDVRTGPDGDWDLQPDEHLTATVTLTPCTASTGSGQAVATSPGPRG